MTGSVEHFRKDLFNFSLHSLSHSAQIFTINHNKDFFKISLDLNKAVSSFDTWIVPIKNCSLLIRRIIPGINYIRQNDDVINIVKGR